MKMKFVQILVFYMPNIANMSLAQCWGLETNSRPFHDFIKITIYRDFTIFNGWHLSFLNVLYSPYQKTKHWNHDKIGY